jgi:hypothetical protein
MKKGILKRTTDRLLKIVEILTEFKTGRPATAIYQKTFSLKIWYKKETDDSGITETYFLPFTKVQIFTPINF